MFANDSELNRDSPILSRL